MLNRLMALPGLIQTIALVNAPAVAAPAPPMTYTMQNDGRDQIIIAVSGTCGNASRPMKPGVRMAGTCSAADGLAVIDAQRFPSKAQLCEARIARQGGIDYVTFNGASMCRMGESLHHLQINAQGSAPHR